MTNLDDRVDVLERRVESLRRYLEEDRSITESVDRLDTGVGNLALVMERLDQNARQISKVEARSKSVERETISKNRRTTVESRVYSGLITTVLVVAVIVVGAHMNQEVDRRSDLERIAVQNCHIANERVDHVAQLARDLTAGAPPEAQARVEQVLTSYLSTKKDCGALT